jgi:hypothetical protein
MRFAVEPLTTNGKRFQDFRYQVRQLDESLRAKGPTAPLAVVDDKNLEKDIRNDCAIVAYKRHAVDQLCGGHISSLGAYDAESDSFLVLYVNPASARWAWMPSETLIKDMRTFDTVENRGYIFIQSP